MEYLLIYNIEFRGLSRFQFIFLEKKSVSFQLNLLRIYALDESRSFFHDWQHIHINRSVFHSHYIAFCEHLPIQWTIKYSMSEKIKEHSPEKRNESEKSNEYAQDMTPEIGKNMISRYERWHRPEMSSLENISSSSVSHTHFMLMSLQAVSSRRSMMRMEQRKKMPTKRNELQPSGKIELFWCVWMAWQGNA